ncbi:MAG: GxxExxY protein [Sphingomonadaceae bacterium]|nr:GxxExxY protein [Sphingomonadaceae bacterium]
MSRDEELEQIAASVVDVGFHLHRTFGPGLLESAYEQLLFADLTERGYRVSRQVSVPLRYKSIVIENAFKVDLLIENQLVVELKSVEKLIPLHGKQVLTYLRVMNLPLGLLMNFGEATFKSGVRRVANDYHAH